MITLLLIVGFPPNLDITKYILQDKHDWNDYNNEKCLNKNINNCSRTKTLGCFWLPFFHTYRLTDRPTKTSHLPPPQTSKEHLRGPFIVCIFLYFQCYVQVL